MKLLDFSREFRTEKEANYFINTISQETFSYKSGLKIIVLVFK